MQTSNVKSDLEQLDKKLSEFFSKENNVVLAYLFGSTVRGNGILPGAFARKIEPASRTQEYTRTYVCKSRGCQAL